MHMNLIVHVHTCTHVYTCVRVCETETEREIQRQRERIQVVTLLSQLPAIRKVEGRAPGLNLRQLTLSSGGDVT